MTVRLDFLGLPGITATQIRAETAETIEVEAEAIDPQFEVCCLAQKVIRQGSRPNRRMVNDTPHSGKAVLIHLKVHMAKCANCGKRGIAERFAQLRPDRHMTERMYQHIARQGLITTNSKVGRELHVSEGTVRSILNEVITTRVRGLKRETPRVLGLDEKMLMRQYRAVLGNVEHRTILDLLPDRDWALHDYFENLQDKDRVEVFCTDMFEGYAHMARRYLPHAAHVTDKFHIVRRANVAVDKIRAAYAATLEGRERVELRYAKKIFAIRMERQPDGVRQKLRSWFNRHPILEQAYWAKERYFEMYEVAHSPKEAEYAYTLWRNTLPDAVASVFKKHCSIAPRWMPTFLNYFEHPYTTGFIEAVNRTLDDIHRAGRGYSFEVMRGKVLLSPVLESKTFRDRNPGAMMQPGADLSPLQTYLWGVKVDDLKVALNSRSEGFELVDGRYVSKGVKTGLDNIHWNPAEAA